MAALIRYGLRKSRVLCQYIHGNGILRDFNKKQVSIPLMTSERCLSAVAERKKRLLIDVHSKIDHNLGISTELFNSLMGSIEEYGPIKEHDAALLLHICSIGPFDSPTSDRLQFAENIWSKLEEMGIQPTAKLYNMKLKVYCANNRSFTPVEELATMKSLGINPDKITYGLLIDGFCQNGDITGANHVLEAMNDAELLIGVSVFNSFITGHLKSGSPQEASNVLETLRTRGLTANSDTYYRFVHHYAKEGDIESVTKYVKEAEQEGVSLDQASLMKIYKLMLQNGKQSEAKKIIPMLLEKDVFRNSSMQNLCHLVAEGLHDEALHLYLNIPKPMTESTPVSAGAFLLKAMVVNNQVAKDVIEVADKLFESYPNTVPHRFALLYAYKMEKYELAVNILEMLMSRKYDVRIPQILPALCWYRDSGNVEGVYKTVDMILSIDPFEELDVMESFCYPALKQLNQSKEDIVTNMKGHENKWYTLFLISDLQKEGCAVALQNVEGKPLDNNLVSCIDNHQMLIRNLPQDKEKCTKLLTKLIKNNGLSKLLAVSVLLSRLDANDLDTLNYMLQVFKQEKIRLPDRCLKYKRVTEAPEDIQEKIKELCEMQVFPYPSGLLSMKEMKEKSKDELEEYIKKYPSQNLARVALLNKSLIEKDLTSIQKRLRELQAMNFSFPKFQLANIIGTLTELGDLEMASHYFEKLQESFGHTYIDTLPLSIAVKHAETGNIEGALEMIDLAKKSEMKKMPGKEFIRRSKIVYLFNNARTMEQAESIHSALVKGGTYLTGDDASLAHYQYIKKSLGSDDDRTLLERLTTLRDQYWIFPCMDAIMTRFIKNQDIESLKTVMDLGISTVGNNMFHHKLACNFIACDMPSKAASIFQKLDDRLNSRILATSCKYFIKNKQVKHVESLVEVVKTLPVSRALMLNQLIEAYIDVNDMVKATNVLQTFDTEFLVPHKSSLNFLVSAFERRNMEQPEILKAFLSKRETLDQANMRESESSSSSESESSSSDSESDSDTDKTELNKEQIQQSTPNDSGTSPTDTKNS